MLYSLTHAGTTTYSSYHSATRLNSLWEAKEPIRMLWGSCETFLSRWIYCNISHLHCARKLCSWSAKNSHSQRLRDEATAEISSSYQDQCAVIFPHFTTKSCTPSQPKTQDASRQPIKAHLKGMVSANHNIFQWAAIPDCWQSRHRLIQNIIHCIWHRYPQLCHTLEMKAFLKEDIIWGCDFHIEWKYKHRARFISPI